MEPIRMWLNFINSDMKRIDIIEGSKEVYRTYKPYIAGIVFTGYCPDRCCHCIYPPDFSRYNQDISPNPGKFCKKCDYSEICKWQKKPVVEASLIDTKVAKRRIRRAG